MRALSVWLLLFLGIVMQSTIFSHLELFGIRPDLVLLVTMSAGLLRGVLEGVLTGFVGGFMLDILHGQFLGLEALGKMAVGYAMGLVSTRIFKDNILVPLVMAGLGTLIDQVVFLFMGTSFGLNYYVWPGAFLVVLPMMLYNSLLAPLVYGRMAAFYNYFERIKLEGRRSLL